MSSLPGVDLNDSKIQEAIQGAGKKDEKKDANKKDSDKRDGDKR